MRTASERKQREVIKQVETSVVKGISAPFTFPTKEERGTYVVGTAAWAYISNFKPHLLGRITSLAE